MGTGDDVRKALLSLLATGAVLIVAVAVQLSQLPWQFTCLIAAAVAVWLAGLRLCPHWTKTSQGRALVYTRRAAGRLVRVMRLGGVYQSATYFGLRWAEPVFAYHRAFDAIFVADAALREVSGRGVRRVLALGGGGFAWPKHALTARPDLEMVVVELDPAIVEAARRWFYVDRLEKVAGARLRIVEGDGRRYLDEHARAVPAAVREGQDLAVPARSAADGPDRDGLFDAIVNDTFQGAEPVRALATVEAARAAKALLVPGGLYAMNVVSRGEGSDLSFLCDEVATLSEVFARVHVIPADDEVYGGEDNYLLVATDLDAPFPEAVPYDDDFLGVPLRDERPTAPPAAGEGDSPSPSCAGRARHS